MTNHTECQQAYRALVEIMRAVNELTHHVNHKWRSALDAVAQLEEVLNKLNSMFGVEGHDFYKMIDEVVTGVFAALPD